MARKRPWSQIFAAVLWTAFLGLYIAAKIDFFTHYPLLESGGYFRHHAIYWATMAAVAFAIWLTQRLSAALKTRPEGPEQR
jgi:cyanate permease